MTLKPLKATAREMVEKASCINDPPSTLEKHVRGYPLPSNYRIPHHQPDCHDVRYQGNLEEDELQHRETESESSERLRDEPGLITRLLLPSRQDLVSFPHRGDGQGQREPQAASRTSQGRSTASYSNSSSDSSSSTGTGTRRPTTRSSQPFLYFALPPSV
jgi:hypothetical protein